jgi:hypothetical protein
MRNGLVKHVLKCNVRAEWADVAGLGCYRRRVAIMSKKPAHPCPARS